MRVRIAVAVAADGKWNAAGWGNDKDSIRAAGECFDGEPVQIHWVEADVPEFVPVTTVKGEVVQ